MKYQKPEVTPLIRLSAVRAAPQVSYIADNAIGLFPFRPTRPLLSFKRLYLSHEYPGTGIGLAILRRIVGSYGGHIWTE
jgi:light-regulated signal transduction histidine kinase (bacteriophytochrome)